MARKGSSESHHGFADVIGIVLLAAAALLLFAQLSFDRGDIGALTTPPNKPLHNWIGWLGVIPLLTAMIGYCPSYSMLGLNTCPVKRL